MVRKRRGDSAEFALSLSQVKDAEAACRDLFDRVIIGCQLWLGLRISELVHMTSDWITEQGELKIPTQMECHCAECARNRQGLWKPKTKAGARTLPIPNRMRKDLAELFKLQPYGLGMSRIGVYHRTKSILKRARVSFKGLARGTGFPHSLRATCATMLALGEMSATGLAYYLGWSNIAVASHYISVAKAKGLAQKEAREIFG